MALTTKELYAEFRQESTPTGSEATAVNHIINAVSEAIESYCDRTFGNTEYREWVDGSGCAELVLENFPLNRIYHCSIFPEQVGYITYTGTSDIASAEIKAPTTAISTGSNVETEGQINTTHYNSSGDRVNTQTTFGYGGTEKTLAQVKTQFDTDQSGTGWSMTIFSGHTGTAAQLLKPAASSFGKNGSELKLEIPLNGHDVDYLDRSNGGIFLCDGGIFPAGRRNIFVDYEAGYTLPATTSTGTLPVALVMIANQAVGDIINQIEKDGSVTSERIGDYAYTLNKESYTNAVLTYRDALAPYRRITI